MPVFLFTFHAYRSWGPDNPHGYVQRGRSEVRRPSDELARHRDRIARHEPVRFDARQQRLLIDSALEICQRREWRLHAATVTASHVHLLVSWTGDAPPDDLASTAKRLLGLMLSKDRDGKGHRWFSRGKDKTRVSDYEHFDHLVEEYLPRHADKGGTFWREDD